VPQHAAITKVEQRVSRHRGRRPSAQMSPPPDEVVVGEDEVVVHDQIVADVGGLGVGVIGSICVIVIDDDSRGGKVAAHENVGIRRPAPDVVVECDITLESDIVEIGSNLGETVNTKRPIVEHDVILLQDNIVFDNWAFGIHCFAKVGPYLHNITLEGNVAFNDYVWGGPSDADIFVGGHFPASGIIIDHNYTYRTNNSNTKAADIGYDLVVNHDLVLTNNYFVGGWAHLGAWATATVSGNTLFDFSDGGMLWNLGDLSGQRWSGNTFFGDSSTLAW